MTQPLGAIDYAILDAFVSLAGAKPWAARLSDIQERAAPRTRAGRSAMQRHAIELAVERLRQRRNVAPSATDQRIARIAAELVETHAQLEPAGRERLRACLMAASRGPATLVPLFHLARNAMLQRERGFEVAYDGLAEAAPYDLLLRRAGVEAELACEVMSAEEGRDVHRGAWFSLCDRIDPELQTWLLANPGRYLLKMTLPLGLKIAQTTGQAEGEADRAGEAGEASADDALGSLHRRITRLLDEQRRADQDETAVIRLDPLMLARAAAAADELGLVSHLRREFGPEAHLAVTASGGGVFVMAARAGRENEVAIAVRRHLANVAPSRLTGTRPGILALFVEDTDRDEWRGLRDTLELEGEARQFLTQPSARRVVAVTCCSRFELFGFKAPDAVADGELRFRNPSHPQAAQAALAPAVASSS